MAKKPIIAETTIDYIRKNKETLEARYPGLFLVFVGIEIFGKFKRKSEALNFINSKNIEAIIWKFDPLPDLVTNTLLEKTEKERKKKLDRLRWRRYYKRNKEKILARQAKDRAQNPENHRAKVKKSYYKDRDRTLRLKKCQRLGIIA